MLESKSKQTEGHTNETGCSTVKTEDKGFLKFCQSEERATRQRSSQFAVLTQKVTTNDHSRFEQHNSNICFVAKQ